MEHRKTLPENTADAKKTLRAEVSARLEALSPGDMVREGREVTGRIRELPEWRQARIILAYLTFGGEFDPGLLMEAALAEGKRLAVPRLRNRTRKLSLGREMDFFEIRDLKGPWDRHPYGMAEPFPDRPAVDPVCFRREEILVITPGLAFDRRRFRLGRGGGFYDTYLGRFPEGLTLVAPAFTCQIVDTVPAEAHDRPLDRVVFPGGIIGGTES